jgi:thiamine monophosphate kinase
MDCHLKSCIYASSQKYCNLYEDKLPLDPQLINVCEEFDIDSTTVAINGGEDYELLSPFMEDFDKIKRKPISPSLDI